MTSLETYLEDNKITQTEFAVSVGATPSTISRICSGKRFPSRQLMKRIVCASGGSVTIEDLLGVDVSQSSPGAKSLSPRKSGGFTP